MWAIAASDPKRNFAKKKLEGRQRQPGELFLCPSKNSPCIAIPVLSPLRKGVGAVTRTWRKTNNIWPAWFYPLVAEANGMVAPILLWQCHLEIDRDQLLECLYDTLEEWQPARAVVEVVV